MNRPLSARTLLIVLACSLTATDQQVEDDWIDPYDMLNYDSSTKTMRKPAEPANYPNVPTKRREYTQDSSQAELTRCERQIAKLQEQIAEHEKRISLMSQQPTYAPVFRRFLSRLLKEIQRFGSPSDSADVFYDAKIKLSRQSMTEIQTFLEGEKSWKTGALDNAISQILVDLRPHNYEAWRWRFEDTFGVELDTLLKLGLFVLVIVAIICTQLWSKVSWFVQFSRLFAVCFFVSIIWNWFYMYKTAFAEHQKNMAKMDGISEKCTGVKRIDWRDSLKEWFRSTLTFQDDPCKKYYEALFVNPVLLVPPTKAISVTIVTFITEPLKHLGEGISDFIRALLKDLPITMQIPVVIAMVVLLVVFTYVSVQATFQHGIMAPFRRPRRDPPPPQLQQQQRQLQGIEDFDQLAGGEELQYGQRHQANGGRLQRNRVRQRRPDRPREEAAKVVVETLHNAECPISEDETDAQILETEQNLSSQSDSENRTDTQEELAGASASSVTSNRAQSECDPAESNSCQLKIKRLKVNENLSEDKHRRRIRTSKSPAEGKPSQTVVEDLKASAENKTSSDSLAQTETVSVPVQESSPVSVE